MLVTHNMQLATRIRDFTAFFHCEELVEFGPTDQLFTRPASTRTEEIAGRLG